MSSIRRTLLVWLLAGLAAIAVAASGATYLAARREAGELLDLQLKQLAYSTRIDDLLRGRRPGFESRQSPHTAGVTELVTQIWDRDGVLVYWTQPGMGLPVPATEGYSTVRQDGRDWRVYTLVQGTHALQVAQAETEREAIATQAALRTLIPFLALLPVFGGLIWLGVGRGLAPLESMSRAVAKPSRATARRTGRPSAPAWDGVSSPCSCTALSPTSSATRRITSGSSSTNTPTAWEWDFQNDGTVDSTEQNPTFTYTTVGTYSVKLTVTNAGGDSSTLVADLITVTVGTCTVPDFNGVSSDNAQSLWAGANFTTTVNFQQGNLPWTIKSQNQVVGQSIPCNSPITVSKN